MQHALTSPLAFHSPQILRCGQDLAPPAWVRDLFAVDAQKVLDDDELQRVDADRFTLMTARVRGAAELSPADVEEKTAAAYASIARELSQARSRHAVRFWNHVPFITDPADSGRDNYMVFNAGRFRAFAEWFGSPHSFDRSLATASAIGHWGSDLVIHCLASNSPGVAISNPRQVAPYHYSQRFGPVPPCFARATRIRIDSRDMLLVGGTASVRGEDSVHADDVIAQCRETFTNLAALLAAATNRKPAPAMKSTLKPAALLASFRELRVYFPDPADEEKILWMIRENFPAVSRIELLPADLCRSELLVEIEGCAELSPRRA